MWFLWDPGQIKGTVQRRSAIIYLWYLRFGGSEDYYEQLFRRAAALLDDSNEIIGHFYCQGKMPMGVRNRYVAMLREHPDDKNMQVFRKVHGSFRETRWHRG